MPKNKVSKVEALKAYVSFHYLENGWRTDDYSIYAYKKRPNKTYIPVSITPLKKK